MRKLSRRRQPAQDYFNDSKTAPVLFAYRDNNSWQALNCFAKVFSTRLLLAASVGSDSILPVASKSVPLAEGASGLFDYELVAFIVCTEREL